MLSKPLKNETFKWLPTPGKICTWALGLNQRGDGLVWVGCGQRCCWAEAGVGNWKTARLSWSSSLHDYRIPFEMSSPTLKKCPYISASTKAEKVVFLCCCYLTMYSPHLNFSPLVQISGSFLETYFYSHSYSSVWYFSIRAHQHTSHLFAINQAYETIMAFMKMI